MSWNNNGGGWKGGGSGGPWGSSGKKGGGPNPQDIEDLLKKGQDKLKEAMPGGGFGGKAVILVLLVLIVLWGLTGFFTVKTDELGVILRFGKYDRTVQPGLNYHLPYPVEMAFTPNVTRINRIDVGYRSESDNIDIFNQGRAINDVGEESLMLTGDENIVDIDFSVFWIINDPSNYLFNVQNPQSTIRAVAESAMREVIGYNNIQPILTEARQDVESRVTDLIQKNLEDYGAGVSITQVKLDKVDPPSKVIDSFRDVQAAKADQERMRNEAQAYANSIVPVARGEAAKIIAGAKGYHDQVIAIAKGDVDRFSSVYEEYKKAPEITRERLFLETLEEVLGQSDKILLDNNGDNGPVQYLPLDQLIKGQRRQ